MSDRLHVGIVCYGSFGGSGIMATELGLAMAHRGHRVHFIGHDTPRRFDHQSDNVLFHGVTVRDYALFPQAPYAIALASKMVDVSRWEHLDLLHVHYAVPHATSAYLARQTLGAGAPAVVTTLHGTDITHVGTDPSYLPVTRFSVEQSDGITVPSRFLLAAARTQLGVAAECPIEVIPNFVDTETFAPVARRDPARIRHLFAASGDDGEAARDVPTLIHVSNFRPLKRVDAVVEVFAGVRAQRPARLVMIGDGPERGRAEARVRELGLHAHTRFLGMQEHFVDLLRHADLFLLPSEAESFGLAALEAMACGVPVVATRVGGVPEVVVDDVTGLLTPPGDTAAMVTATLALLDAPARRDTMGQRARERVLAHFRREPLVDRWEVFYREALRRGRNR